MSPTGPSPDKRVDPAQDSTVLAVNSGSSSLKFALYKVGPHRLETLLSGEAAAIGEPAACFRAQDSQGATLIDESGPIPGQREAIARIVRLLAGSESPLPDAVGHRIVHGGPMLRRHCLIDPSVSERIEAAVAFAPLHGLAALSVIRFAQAHFPGVPQVACFDTAFHADLPDVAAVLPIPEDLRSRGIRRYGFHGLSCESILRQIAAERPARLIIAHLGSGASVTAIRDGRSIDTSMGLTPTGGVIMGTRSGDLDPGVLLYLMRQAHFDAAAIEDLVDRRSGLAGVSGLCGDMRVLREAAASNPAAALAVEMFGYSVAKQIAAMIAALRGVDKIIFTGGIGENDPPVRAAICAALAWIGVRLDPVRNRAQANPISDPASRCRVLVLPSREDEEIARHAWALTRAERARASAP